MLLSFFCSTPFSILFTCCLPTGRHLSVGRLSSHLCAGNALALSLRRRFTVSLVELGLCYHSIASLYSHSFHTAINVHFALWLYCIFICTMAMSVFHVVRSALSFGYVLSSSSLRVQYQVLGLQRPRPSEPPSGALHASLQRPPVQLRH